MFMLRNINQRSLGAALVSGAFLLGASGCHRTESTASLLAEAKQYQQKGDNKAALIQLKNAVAGNPQDGEARFQLAGVYYAMGDFPAAENDIRKAMGMGIDAKRALPLLGESLLAEGQFQKLLDQVTPEAAKQSGPLLALRGNAQLALNDLPAAKASYEQALALAPNNGAALTGLARYALMQKDLPAALLYADQATAKDPNSSEAWLFKGMLLRDHGKAEEALAAFDQAIKLAPGGHMAPIEKAYADMSLGRFDAAGADIALAHKAAPGSLIVVYADALLQFNQGKNAKALESLQKVLRAAPDYLPAILMAGAIELNLGSTRQSEQHLRKYLETYPNNVYARKLLAQVLLRNAQPADAAAILAPALKEPSTDPQLLALAGVTYMQSHDFDKASSYLERASALTPKAAGLHTSLGLSKLAQGDQAAAVHELEQGVALDPASPEAGVALVQTELGLQHYDKALDAAKALEQRQPKNPKLAVLTGAVYLKRGDVANARASFERASALQPSFFPAQANLAQLDMREKKPDAARQRFLSMLEKDKSNVDAMTALARIEAAVGRPAQATEWLEKANAVNPDASAPAVQLAVWYLRTQQERKALTLARKLQTSDPANPDLLDLLGQCQLANNDPSGALETYAKLVAVLPKSAPAQLRMATVHMRMKNEALAAADLERAVAADPAFMPARAAQAELAVHMGKPEQALEIARQIQKQDAKAPFGYVLEGDLAAARHQTAQAVAAYDKALAISGTPQLAIKIAETLKQGGKAKDAQARLAQWQREHPDDLMVPMYVGESHLANKEYKEASEQFAAILKKRPDNPLVLNNLAWTYQQLKDPRALETAERAFKLAPGIPAVADTLGWMLVERGDTARGLALLQKAVALTPADPDLRYHLAFALNQAGDKAGARKELDLLLSSNKPFAQIEQAKSLRKML